MHRRSILQASNPCVTRSQRNPVHTRARCVLLTDARCVPKVRLHSVDGMCVFDRTAPASRKAAVLNPMTLEFGLKRSSEEARLRTPLDLFSTPPSYIIAIGIGSKSRLSAVRDERPKGALIVAKEHGLVPEVDIEAARRAAAQREVRSVHGVGVRRAARRSRQREQAGAGTIDFGERPPPRTAGCCLSLLGTGVGTETLHPRPAPVSV
jgi:hypothetical protein